MTSSYEHKQQFDENEISCDQDIRVHIMQILLKLRLLEHHKLLSLTDTIVRDSLAVVSLVTVVTAAGATAACAASTARHASAWIRRWSYRNKNKTSINNHVNISQESARE